MADLAPTRAIGVDGWLSVNKTKYVGAFVLRTDLAGEWTVTPWLELYGRAPLAAGAFQSDDFGPDDSGVMTGNLLLGGRVLLRPGASLVVGLGGAALLPTSLGDSDHLTALRLHHLGHQPYLSAGYAQDNYNGQMGVDLVSDELAAETVASVGWRWGRRRVQLEVAIYSALADPGPQVDTLRLSAGGGLPLDARWDVTGELSLILPAPGDLLLPGFDLGLARRVGRVAVGVRYHLAIGPAGSYWRQRSFLGALGLSLWMPLPGA